MKELGWSRPKERLVRKAQPRQYAVGLSHLLVEYDDGSTRARCGAEADTTLAFQTPPVRDLADVCLRCKKPYAKNKRRGALKAPKATGETNG